MNPPQQRRMAKASSGTVKGASAAVGSGQPRSCTRTAVPHSSPHLCASSPKQEQCPNPECDSGIPRCPSLGHQRPPAVSLLRTPLKKPKAERCDLLMATANASSDSWHCPPHTGDSPSTQSSGCPATALEQPQFISRRSGTAAPHMSQHQNTGHQSRIKI